jgi:hypothetical protein
MGGKFDSQLWFNAISNYTLQDYCEMTSNNEGQSCEENCFVFFFSFFFLFSRDQGRIPRLLRLFLFFLFGRLLGVQQLGSLTSYRTAAGSGVWGRRLFRALRRLHLPFVVAVRIIQSFCCFPFCRASISRACTSWSAAEEIGPCSSLQWTDFVVCLPRRLPIR